MPLILAGIDEAGYGPLLGPLCVGMTVLRIGDWKPGDPAPDLWDRLDAAVCRAPGDQRARIAIEDSKKLKLPSSSARGDAVGGRPRRHPVMHLERGVLAVLAAMDRRPQSDAELFDEIGVRCERHGWYDTLPRALPLSHPAEQISIAGNMLRGACTASGVLPLAVRCRVLCEDEYNEVTARAGNKAAATELALSEHLRYLWNCPGYWPDSPGDAGPEAAADQTAMRVVCDRQGGRIDYRESLSRALPRVETETLEQSDRCSRYRLIGRSEDGAPRDLTVMFLPEAEGRHLPVALASMAAKLVRELLMARFNTHWCGLCAELKPTAGYRQDGWRWIQDAQRAGVLSDEDRKTMIRRV